MVSTWAERVTTTQRLPLSSPRRNGWLGGGSRSDHVRRLALMRSTRRPARSTARSGPKTACSPALGIRAFEVLGRARRRSGCDRRSDYRPRASGRLASSHASSAGTRPLPRWVRGDFARRVDQVLRTNRAAWSELVLRVGASERRTGPISAQQLALRFNAPVKAWRSTSFEATSARPGLRGGLGRKAGAAGISSPAWSAQANLSTTRKNIASDPRDEVGHRLACGGPGLGQGGAGRGGKRSIGSCVHPS